MFKASLQNYSSKFLVNMSIRAELKKQKKKSFFQILVSQILFFFFSFFFFLFFFSFFFFPFCVCVSPTSSPFSQQNIAKLVLLNNSSSIFYFSHQHVCLCTIPKGNNKKKKLNEIEGKNIYSLLECVLKK